MKATDLAVRSLADCIMDYKHLTTLYPCTDKLEALRNYISPPKQFPVGMDYVPSIIRAEI